MTGSTDSHRAGPAAAELRAPPSACASSHCRAPAPRLLVLPAKAGPLCAANDAIVRQLPLRNRLCSPGSRGRDEANNQPEDHLKLSWRNCTSAAYAELVHHKRTSWGRWLRRWWRLRRSPAAVRTRRRSGRMRRPPRAEFVAPGQAANRSAAAAAAAAAAVAC